MKKFKYFACLIALASLLAFAITPHNIYATEGDGDAETTTEATEPTTTEDSSSGDESTPASTEGVVGDASTQTTTTNEDGSTTTTTTVTSGDGSTTTTTTTTTSTDENGNPTTHTSEDTVIRVSTPAEMPIQISLPSNIVHPANGEYTVNYSIRHTYDLEGVRMIKGQKSYTDWDAATPCSPTEIIIPEEQSDSWYTVIAKDVNGNWAVASIYAHCEKDEPSTAPIEVTPTPSVITPSPEQPGCPDGYTLQPDGTCVTCPEGYQLDSTGNCIKIPTVVAQNDCPEGKYMDENGNCVDKITSLPQTGGFDGPMLFFIFGIGLAACGTGVICYTRTKDSKNNENIDVDEDIDDDDNDDEE